jgi:hypothetical protein
MRDGIYIARTVHTVGCRRLVISALVRREELSPIIRAADCSFKIGISVVFCSDRLILSPTLNKLTTTTIFG